MVHWCVSLMPPLNNFFLRSPKISYSFKIVWLQDIRKTPKNCKIFAAKCQLWILWLNFQKITVFPFFCLILWDVTWSFGPGYVEEVGAAHASRNLGLYDCISAPSRFNVWKLKEKKQEEKFLILKNTQYFINLSTIFHNFS